MKKIIVMLLALAPMFAFAQKAQPKKTVDERVENQTERLAKDLDLNENQKAQVTAINKKYLEQTQQRKEEAQADKQARHEAAQQMKANHEAEIKAVLTEAQYAKYQELQAARQEKRQAKVEKWKSKKGKGTQKK